MTAKSTETPQEDSTSERFFVTLQESKSIFTLLNRQQRANN